MESDVCSKELSRGKNSILKKADKETTTVIINREHKIHEDQVLFNHIDGQVNQNFKILSLTILKQPNTKWIYFIK